MENSSFESFTQENMRSELNNLYIQQASAVDLDNTAIAQLIWYNNNGGTIRTQEYYSPYFLENEVDDYINPLYSILLSNSTIYMTAVISQAGNANNVCIWHFDKDGNELWHYIYAMDADPKTCYTMVPWQGGVMAAIFKGISKSDEDGLILLQLDGNGNYIGEIDKSVWNNYARGIRAMLQEENYVISAGSSWQDLNLDPQMTLWKIDNTWILVWTCPISVQVDFDLRTLSSFVKTIDNNYVVSGDFYTLGEEINSYHSYARVTKVNSESGNIILSCSYSIIESQNNIQNANDLKATPDGGVVFCGHASDAWSQNPNLELPVQQGWIVKLDACGCLVPGCDQNCTVSVAENETVANQSLFIVGPNPAQDILNIYLKEISGVQYEDIVFEIFDLSGKLVKSFSPYLLVGQGLYMVPISSTLKILITPP